MSEQTISEILPPVLNVLPDPVIVTDRNWRILFVNRAAERKFRFQAASVAGEKLSAVLEINSPVSFSEVAQIVEKHRFR